LLLVSGTELGKRVEQHRAVIEAAKAAGVELIAYTSLLRADTSTLPIAGEHQATEELLRGSGIPWVLLRNGWYIDNYTDTTPLGRLGQPVDVARIAVFLASDEAGWLTGAWIPASGGLQ